MYTVTPGGSAEHDVLGRARMSVAIDRELLAERAATVARHLRVVLHLWQAVQVVIDLAVSSCVRLGLGSPPTYADAFRMLATARLIPGELAQRLGHAAGFRNLIMHAYAELDLRRVHTAATSGPADLRAFLAALRDHTG
jgi:uncharacterized protein YutE (UPF0331/DUF86 family)